MLICKKFNLLNIMHNIHSKRTIVVDNYKMNKVKELNIDNTLWVKPAKIVNLLDINPEKLSINKEINNIHNTPDLTGSQYTRSQDLIDIYQVRYDDGVFYLTIDNIKGYFKFDGDISGILDMILTDDQKNKYHQVWKEVFKLVNDGNRSLMLHEKIRLFDVNLPVEKIFKIPSITIVIKSLIEKENKFYLELALNHCLFEL